MIRKIIRNIKRILYNSGTKILRKLTDFNVYIVEKRYIKSRKNIVNSVILNKEQIKAIDEIWIKNYGRKISKKWHKLYTYYMGIFDERYFPEIFFTSNLLNKLNPPDRRKYLSDKILTQNIFKGIKECKTVKSYIYNCNGYFYDDNGIIDYDEAVNKIKNLGEVIIKPTVETGSGHNVNLLNIKNEIDTISGLNIKQILNKYGKNYVIQEKITQHKTLAKLNPSSVNTIRINTYICEGKVYCAPVVVRLGRNGSIVDNLCAKGMSVGIDENLKLRKMAFTQDGEKFEYHPDTNVKFEGYEIPKVKECIEFAKKYHHLIPHMGIIAWDLALDENENIVVIETNINVPGVWFPQYSNGKSFFGNNTEKMIRMLKEK